MTIMSKLLQKLKALKKYCETAVMQWNIKHLTPVQRTIVRLVQIITVVVHKARRDNAPLQASALSYITILAMVPVLAIAFAISSAFGAQERLTSLIEKGMADYPADLTAIIDKITQTIEGANYGALGGIGALAIFLVAVRMLSKIENTFNTIWETNQRRPYIRRITDYIAVVVLVPLLLLTATSAGTFLASTRVESFLSEKIGVFVYVYHAGTALTGFAAVVLGFSFLYLFMPNTRVNLKPAFTGGVVAGILWALLQWLYITSQIGMTRLNPIYGSFAAIPLFLGWIFASWVIVLIGAQISFAVQNRILYVQQVFGKAESESSKEVIALMVMYDIAKDFVTGSKRWSITDYTSNSIVSSVSHNTLIEVLSALEAKGLILKVNKEDAEYVPGRDLSNLTAADVVEAVKGEEDADISEQMKNQAFSLYRLFRQYREQTSQKLKSLNYKEALTQETLSISNDEKAADDDSGK